MAPPKAIDLLMLQAELPYAPLVAVATVTGFLALCAWTRFLAARRRLDFHVHTKAWGGVVKVVVGDDHPLAEI